MSARCGISINNKAVSSPTLDFPLYFQSQTVLTSMIFGFLVANSIINKENHRQFSKAQVLTLDP